MKHIVCTIVCLLSASSAFAAPKVTEIRLADYPGYGPNGHLQSEFVFRADNSFYWVKGIGTEAVRQRYTLKAGEFQKLAESLDSQRFFALKPYYPVGPMITDVPKFVVSATRDGQKTEVTYNYNNRPNSQPFNLWTIEKVLRGVALQTTRQESPPSQTTN